MFESAAVTFRRADYRPSWLYWAARSRATLGDFDAAIAGYQQVIADYRNSYYGREAVRASDSLPSRGGRPHVSAIGARRAAPRSRRRPPRRPPPPDSR